jgi:hypothetical protein
LEAGKGAEEEAGGKLLLQAGSVPCAGAALGRLAGELRPVAGPPLGAGGAGGVARPARTWPAAAEPSWMRPAAVRDRSHAARRWQAESGRGYGLSVGAWARFTGSRSVRSVGPPGKSEARQGLRAGRPTRPAGPALHSAGPHGGGPTRDDGLDFAPWHAPQVKPCESWQGKVLAGRKPTRSPRSDGTYPSRKAQRTNNAR